MMWWWCDGRYAGQLLTQQLFVDSSCTRTWESSVISLDPQACTYIPGECERDWGTYSTANQGICKNFSGHSFGVSRSLISNYFLVCTSDNSAKIEFHSGDCQNTPPTAINQIRAAYESWLGYGQFGYYFSNVAAGVTHGDCLRVKGSNSTMIGYTHYMKYNVTGCGPLAKCKNVHSASQCVAPEEAKTSGAGSIPVVTPLVLGVTIRLAQMM
jgi:hypothetical protein